MWAKKCVVSKTTKEETWAKENNITSIATATATDQQQQQQKIKPYYYIFKRVEKLMKEWRARKENISNISINKQQSTIASNIPFFPPRVLLPILLLAIVFYSLLPSIHCCCWCRVFAFAEEGEWIFLRKRANEFCCVWSNKFCCGPSSFSLMLKLASLSCLNPLLMPWIFVFKRPLFI